MTDYLIIGNGVAGTTAAENIREIDKEGKITIVSDEDLPFYYRIRLNEYISGDIGEKELLAKKEEWYGEMNIDLVLRTPVAGALSGEKVLTTRDDKRLSYDRLLIATGSHSFVPPIKGSDRKGVFSLRDLRDARKIIDHARDIDRVVLIGGGLLGLESGNAFRKLGKEVMVVEFFPRLLPRQLDVDGAKRLQTIMEGMGFSFRLGAKTEEIEGDDALKAVRLDGGERLPADMVVISAGVRPNMEIAGFLDIESDKGVKVNERLMTSRPDVYAAGDVVEFKGIVYGIWPAAMEQGKIAGINMAGGDRIYEGTTMANSLKVVGIDLASAGEVDAENRYESRVESKGDIYKKIVIDNDRIIGCIMLGDTKGFNKITRAMSEKLDVSRIKDRILTGGFNFI